MNDLIQLFTVVLCMTACFIPISKWTHYVLQHRYKDIKRTVLICPLVFSCRMLTSSSLAVFNVLHGYYNGIHDCSTIIFVCWVNSVNYWRYPTQGIRRNMDITTILFATCYHVNCSYEVVDGYIYRIGVLTSFVWYCLALYFGRFRLNNSFSSVCHLNIHSTAIIFNAWLISELYKTRTL